MNVRLALRQRTDLLQANIPVNKISLPQGQSYTEISLNSCQKSFTLESLIKSDDNENGNENGKKATGLIRKNNNSARALRFFAHFFFCRHGTKVANFTCCLFFLFFGGHEHKTTTVFLFSWTSIQSFKIQLKKSLPPTFDELNEMEYKSKKFEAAQNSLNSLFDVFFSRRCRYCALYYVLKPPVIFFKI